MAHTITSGLLTFFDKNEKFYFQLTFFTSVVTRVVVVTGPFTFSLSGLNGLAIPYTVCKPMASNRKMVEAEIIALLVILMSYFGVVFAEQ